MREPLPLDVNFKTTLGKRYESNNPFVFIPKGNPKYMSISKSHLGIHREQKSRVKPFFCFLMSPRKARILIDINFNKAHLGINSKLKRKERS